MCIDGVGILSEATVCKVWGIRTALFGVRVVMCACNVDNSFFGLCVWWTLFLPSVCVCTVCTCSCVCLLCPMCPTCECRSQPIHTSSPLHWCLPPPHLSDTLIAQFMCMAFWINLRSQMIGVFYTDIIKYHQQLQWGICSSRGRAEKMHAAPW